MRTMEVIDNMARGRYTHDLALSTDDGSVASGMGSPTNSSSFEVQSGADFDDDSSFAGSNLEADLEREFTRRYFRKWAKRCAFVAVLGLGLMAVMFGSGGKGKHLFSFGKGQQVEEEPQPEIGALGSDAAAGDGIGNDNNDDDPFPIQDLDDTNDNQEEVIATVEEGVEDIESLAALFNAAQALPPYKICPPPLVRDRQATQANDAVFHMGEFRTVPEDDPDVGSYEYTLSDMDVSDDASIIALGMGDYAADTGYAVGMVRVFAYACESNSWQRLGQDLLGIHEYEMFGHRVSSNRDGTILAISAPQGDYDGGKGFVEVYSIDNENTGKWVLLGSRIEFADDTDVVSGYYMLGHAVDISDRGETLAVLGIVDDEYENPSYVTRVFDYDYRKKEWMRKGHDLVIANVTFGNDYRYDFSPQVSLSDKGDKLIVTDPQMGVVKYHFHFGLNHWKEEESRTPTWNDDIEKEFWISSLDLDDKGELVAFSAYEEEEVQEEDGTTTTTYVDSVKFVDFQQQESSSSSSKGKHNDEEEELSFIPVDVYARDFRGWQVGLSVSVSDQGNVAAFVASKIDVDDTNWWDLFNFGDYNEDYIGALTVVTKYEGDDEWSVVGKGTDAESLGVSGNKVSLSGDGQIAAVGYDTVVSLYGISLDRPNDSATGTTASVEVTAVVAEQENAEQEDNNAASPTTSQVVNICTPFPNSTSNDGPLGIIDDLPHPMDGKENEQHTLSLALSEDGSIVAVGIDSFDGEDRGLVRTFGWSCEEGRYLRLGQDLLGDHEFDGFGQSVGLSADGKTLAVGANQPPPGKSGYVNVYNLQVSEWKRNGHIKEFPEEVFDAGRGVHLSNDGKTLMILGSINHSNSGSGSSYIRVLQKKNGKWLPMGEDMIASIQYDDYGVSAHAALSGDGKTLAVTGSYSQFFAKLYQFDESSSSWAETVIPPPSSCVDDDESEETIMDDDYLDYYYECYFSGEDISVNSAATFLAIGGTGYDSSSGEIGVVRVLSKNITTGNFTVAEDPIDITSDYYVSSVDISDDGQHLAVGIRDHSDDLEGQGQGISFLSQSFVPQSPGNWIGVGKVDGTNETDLLGARVRITSDGQLAAASSRRGYISFFRAG